MFGAPLGAGGPRLGPIWPIGKTGLDCACIAAPANPNVYDADVYTTLFSCLCKYNKYTP